MSLIITLYLGEGIVMASDSRITYNTQESKQDGTIVVNNGVHFSDSTYKTFLTCNNIGISTCGQASINNKPIAGYVESFISEYKDLDVIGIKDTIVPYFKKLCPTINTHFIVGGYMHNGKTYQQKVYKITTTPEVITELDTSNQGAVWDGEIDVLSRILISVYVENDNSYTPMIQYNIPFNHFTIQDAIDFAKYAIQATSDTMKFQQRVKTVGGDVDILIIKPDNAFWIAKKELHK